MFCFVVGFFKSQFLLNIRALNAKITLDNLRYGHHTYYYHYYYILLKASFHVKKLIYANSSVPMDQIVFMLTKLFSLRRWHYTNNIIITANVACSVIYWDRYYNCLYITKRYHDQAFKSSWCKYIAKEREWNITSRMLWESFSLVLNMYNLIFFLLKNILLIRYCLLKSCGKCDNE